MMRTFLQLRYELLPAPPELAEWLGGLSRIDNPTDFPRRFTVLPDGYVESIKKCGAVQLLSWPEQRWHNWPFIPKLNCPTLFDALQNQVVRLQELMQFVTAYFDTARRERLLEQ